MTHLLLSWGYGALFLATMLAALGIPTGSELVIGYAGALASGHLLGGGHHFHITAVILLASAGEIVGAFGGYVVGRAGGRPLFERYGRYVLLTAADLDRAEALFARRGEPVVFFGRFIPILRSFVGLAAGIAQMSVTKFTIFTVVAATMWCTAFALAGDALGSSWNKVLGNVSFAGYLVGGIVIVGIALLVIGRLRALRGEREGRAAPSERLES